MLVHFYKNKASRLEGFIFCLAQMLTPAMPRMLQQMQGLRKALGIHQG